MKILIRALIIFLALTAFTSCEFSTSMVYSLLASVIVTCIGKMAKAVCGVGMLAVALMLVL